MSRTNTMRLPDARSALQAGRPEGCQRSQQRQYDDTAQTRLETVDPATWRVGTDVSCGSRRVREEVRTVERTNRCVRPLGVDLPRDTESNALSRVADITVDDLRRLQDLRHGLLARAQSVRMVETVSFGFDVVEDEQSVRLQPLQQITCYEWWVVKMFEHLGRTANLGRERPPEDH